jgi:hypothetical protein
MESTRRLRRELSFEFAKLNGLQRSVDLTVDDASTKALATEVRKQAGVCLKLLDKYQLSMPGRMRTYSEGHCQRFREDLKRTEMHFRESAGEFERRLPGESERAQAADVRWRGFNELEEALDGADALDRADALDGADAFDGADAPDGEEALDSEEALDIKAIIENTDPGLSGGQEDEIPSISPVALSRRYIEAQNDKDIDGLMALLDEDVEFKLAFDPPLKGSAAVRRHYEQEWADNGCVVVDTRDVFESDEKVAIEIHVDNGSPSNLLYNGVVVHRWNDEGRLTHHQLYVDEVIPA